MMKFDRNAILEELKHNVCEVRFTKVNGDERIMRCTLLERYLPQAVDYKHLEEMHNKEENKSTIVAWDLISNGWRSFRVENVSYVEAIESN